MQNLFSSLLRQDRDFPKIFDVLDMVIENHALRVQTGVLNEILTEGSSDETATIRQRKEIKTFTILQVSVKPPTFVVFINDRQLMHFHIQDILRTRSVIHLDSEEHQFILLRGKGRKDNGSLYCCVYDRRIPFGVFRQDILSDE